MDSDETSWASIRPLNDASTSKTLMEFCTRQVPVPYLTANSSDPAVKDFLVVMESAVKEDEEEVASKLGKLLVEDTTAIPPIESTIEY